jgi:excisionase family DNA binding protein
MAAVPDRRTVLPPAEDNPVMVGLAAALDAPTASLVGPGGVPTPLPAEVHQVLKAVVDAMAQGLAVSVEPHNTQLSVQEAADLLGMDRPRLVRLLDHGTIPFEHRGRQRVVMLADVIDYQERVRAKRRATLDEMTRTTAEDGTHDTLDGFIETR